MDDLGLVDRLLIVAMELLVGDSDDAVVHAAERDVDGGDGLFCSGIYFGGCKISNPECQSC